MSTELPIFSDTPPSEFIQKVFRKYGSPMILCEPCGRIHYNDEQFRELEQEEIDEIKSDMEKKPDMYLYHDTRLGISYIHHNDQQIVLKCPCHFLTTIEEKWWEDREMILEYLKSRATHQKDEAIKNFNEVFSVACELQPGD